MAYTLPGTTITDTTSNVTVSTTSSQRKPCFIGLASPYVAVSKEAITRGSTKSDSLVNSDKGINRITAVGSSSGMNNFKSGTHWNLVDDEITWVDKVENEETKTITSIKTPLAYNVSIGTPVVGTDATSGYAIVSTSPNTIVSSSITGLSAGAYQLCITANGSTTQTRTIVVIVSTTWAQLVDLINDQFSAVGITASIVSGAFKFTSSVTGSSSSVIVADGGTSGLLAAISSIGTYVASTDTAVSGIAATSGYSTVSYTNVISGDAVHNLAEGNYYASIAVDSGSATNYLIPISNGGYYYDILNALNSYAGISASINLSGSIVVKSNTSGITSKITINEYTTDATHDIFTAMATALGTKAIGSAIVGTGATIGSQSISSSKAQFVSSSLTRIPAGSYNIGIAANGAVTANNYVVALSGSETWAGLVTLINTAVISSATATLNSGKIYFTSKVSGSSSNITITDGVTSGLISAINAVTGLYVTASPVSVAGNAAVSGYVELSSISANFAPTSYCNLNSGVYHINVALNGGESSAINIQILNSTDTWSNVVSSISVSGMSASIVNNNLRLTSNTTGASSSVTASDGSDNATAFIATLNTLSADSITVVVPALEYERTFDEAVIKYTNGVSTYSYSIKSDIVDAQTVLTLYAPIASLKALKVGSTLNLSSVGSWVAKGAKYYVSYYYNRPDSDYNVYKEFTDFDDVKKDLGADVAGNTIVNLCNLALNSYGLPVVGVVQIKSATKTNFLNALETIKYKDVQTVLPISSDPDVRSYAITHVTERSLPASKRYRITYLGAPAGTVVGAEDNTKSLCGIASAIKNKLAILVNATRGLYYYTDESGNEQSVLVDGSFIAAAVGAYRDSFSDPTATLMNKSIPGIDLLDDDYDDYYNEYWLTKAGASSCFLLAPSAAGGMKVVDDLTTDNTSVEKNNINIVTTEHYIASDVIVQMNKFHGNLINDQASYIDNIGKFLDKLFSEYKRTRVIAKKGYTKAAISSTRNDTVIISYGYYSVYTHKYTEGTYELL